MFKKMYSAFDFIQLIIRFHLNIFATLCRINIASWFVFLFHHFTFKKRCWTRIFKMKLMDKTLHRIIEQFEPFAINSTQITAYCGRENDTIQKKSFWELKDDGTQCYCISFNWNKLKRIWRQTMVQYWFYRVYGKYIQLNSYYSPTE